MTPGENAEQLRRSWLIVPASKPALIEEAAGSGADVIVLDLVEFVAEKDKAQARAQFHASIAAARRSGVQVFAQIDLMSMSADLDACVWTGLDGIVAPSVESAEQISQLAAALDVLEKECDLPAHSVRIVAGLETARGNHAAYDILRASPRVWGATLGRADLVMNLRPEPSGEIHLVQYLMQRLVIIAGAVDVMPIGAWWRAADRGLLATPENTYQAAHRGRAIGFKGAMCLRANQIEPINRAYA